VRRLGLVVVALLALPASAHASFHQAIVNEVLTSIGGDTTKQFVEMYDPFGEPFPATSGPYHLVSYDSAGTVQQTQTLNTPLPSTPFLVSTPQADAALGTSGNQALTISLPQGAGAVCFTHGATDAKVHCMKWGAFTAANFPGVSGAAPDDGKSLQNCDTGAVVAAPTPKAANSCSAGGGGGGTGTGGGGGTGGSTTDTTKPRATLSAKVQKLGAVLAFGYRFKVKSNEKGGARAQLLRKGKVLMTSTKSLTAGVFKAFSLRPPKETRDALKLKRSATFVLKIRVTDAAGNVRNVTRTLRLTR
jgi:hypothetical protein